MTVYLSTDGVIALHARAVRATGDSPTGIRDHGGLESAVMRPRFLAHYAGADIITQAAALATGLSRAQAFVDGNKRVAYLAALVFLELNQSELAGDAMALAKEIEAVADPGVRDDDADRRLAAWLAAHTRTMP